jgi:hypothetical protein
LIDLLPLVIRQIQLLEHAPVHRAIRAAEMAVPGAATLGALGQGRADE